MLGRILLLTPLVLLLALCCAFLWILESGSGTRWLWQRVAASVPGELTAESTDGALADGFSVAGLRYASGSFELAITSARLAVTPTIFPLAVDLAEVSAGEVTIRLRQAPEEGSPDGISLSDVLARLELPLPARIDSLALDALRVLAHDGREMFAMRDVSFAGSLHERIELERARLAIGAFTLEGSGELALDAPNAVEATVGLEIAPDAADFLNNTPVRLSAVVRGDFAQLGVAVNGKAPQFRLDGSLRDVATRPRWDVRLAADSLEWPLGADDPAVRARAVKLASEGRLSRYSLRGTAVVAPRQGGAFHTAIDADGDTRGLRFSALELSGDPATASLHGRLDWSPVLSVEAAGDVARFDLHRVWPDWPAQRAVHGTLDASWRAGSIELAELAVGVENTTMSLESTGTIDPAKGIVDLALEWRDLEWPVGADAPQVTSESGEIRLAGEPDAWQVDGRIALAVAGYPGGSFTVRGEGDRDRAAASLAESRLLGGSARGSVAYDWRNGAWSASLAADDIHTEPVLAAWPGVLDAEFDASGTVRPFAVDLEVEKFGGTMHGLPVAGSGGFRYGADALEFRDLRIESGESSVALDGLLQSGHGIDFEVDVAALGALVPPASGSVVASGNVAVPDGFPRLTIDLDGRDLGWRSYRAGRLAIETIDGPAGGDSPGPPLALRLDAGQVELDGRVLETVTAFLTAGPHSQRFEGEVATADGSLAAVLDGALEDWRRPLASRWRGQLEALTLTAEPDAALALQRPAALEMSQGFAALQQFCLAGRGDLTVCGNGHWAGADDFHATADLGAFPVDALRFVIDTGLEFTQSLDGRMTFTRTPEKALSGDMALAISSGRIRNRLDERLATTTGEGTLSMHLADGQLLSGRMHLPVSDASEIDARFAVVDVARGEASPVEGQLRLVVNDIGIAARVTPTITAATGRLEADVAISGTVGQPAIAGDGSLVNGSVTYEPLGLRLENLALSGHIREQNRLELEGTFRAGEGSGRIYTSADYRNGAEAGLRVRLSGQNLTVVDVPDLLVIADPELDFGLDDGTITVDGSIDLPRARLSPANLASNPVRESDDVVVVAGQPEQVEEASEEATGIEIEGEVELTLGDDIVVDLDVADAEITGNTTFRWSGPIMPAADGQYLVSGSFRAYGQLLEITEGVVNFPNVPADNPVLRIRAEREIFGNSQIRSAGVFISGTAKDPEVEVYTNPATTESRALSLLVTGSDFNFEQGVGAVDVGTYVAPKLYLAYGIGLFERENVISLRYDIARGFGIKASSSTRTDGIDLSYTIER